MCVQHSLSSAFSAHREVVTLYTKNIRYHYHAISVCVDDDTDDDDHSYLCV